MNREELDTIRSLAVHRYSLARLVLAIMFGGPILRIPIRLRLVVAVIGSAPVFRFAKTIKYSILILPSESWQRNRYS